MPGWSICSRRAAASCWPAGRRGPTVLCALSALGARTRAICKRVPARPHSLRAVAHETRLITHLRLPPTQVARYLRHIESGYKDNPYHNATHAADVLQTLHSEWGMSAAPCCSSSSSWGRLAQQPVWTAQRAPNPCTWSHAAAGITASAACLPVASIHMARLLRAAPYVMQ
jgi:hypothetical protein